jgi:tetratricopeptide (TPR) repeat protein
MASVIGAAFTLELLEQVVDGVDADGVLDAVEEAVNAHVVVELGHGEYRFSHALVRETIYSGLTTTRRGRHHRRVGEALESMGDGEERYFLPALAYHFAEAARAGCALKAADYAMAAARHAVSQAAWEDAIARLERGLKALEAQDPLDLERRCSLLLLLAEAWTRFFNPPRALVTAKDAVDAARALGSADRLGSATYWYVRAASGTADPQDMSVATQLAEEALAALGEALPAVRAKILAVLARIQDTRGQSSESTSCQAMTLARRSGDPEALGVALLTATGFVGSLYPRERLALAEELVSAAPPDGWDGWRDGHSQRAMSRLALGDRSGFEADVGACERLGVERRFWFFRWIGALWRATLALIDGRFDEVEALAGRARAITLQDAYQLLSSVQLFRLRFEQGNMTDAKDVVVRTLEDLPENPILRAMHALVLAESEAMTQAMKEYERIADDRCAGVPWPLRPIALAYRTEVAVALGDVDRADWLYEDFRPYSGQVVLSGVASTCVGAVDRYLGMLASTMGRWSHAEGHYRDAAALEAGLASPPTTARTQYWHGRMLLDRAAPGDADRARGLLAGSLETAERLGMGRLAAQSGALLPNDDVRRSLETAHEQRGTP